MFDPRDYILLDEIDKNGPQSYSRMYSISSAELDRIEIINIDPVALTANANKGNLPSEYLVDGTSRFTADLACSRCLEPSPFASSSSFHLRFRPRPELLQQEGEELEIAPEELDVEFYTERAISLRDCLGLCLHCGANRNRETCACESSIVGEQWGALREIQQAMKKRES